MKKVIALCCALVLGMAGTAFALNVGSWDLGTEGNWFEQWVPSVGTTMLTASAFNNQLQLSNLWMIDSSPNPDGTSTNTYAGGTLLLGERPDLWGDAVSIGVNSIDIARQTETTLEASMSFFGTHEGLEVLITAQYSGVAGINYEKNDLEMWHRGAGFESLTLQISDSPPVPEPGTMLLFGLGLFGVVALRKKR